MVPEQNAILLTHFMVKVLNSIDEDNNNILQILAAHKDEIPLNCLDLTGVEFCLTNSLGLYIEKKMKYVKNFSPEKFVRLMIVLLGDEKSSELGDDLIVHKLTVCCKTSIAEYGFAIFNGDKYSHAINRNDLVDPGDVDEYEMLNEYHQIAQGLEVIFQNKNKRW